MARWAFARHAAGQNGPMDSRTLFRKEMRDVAGGRLLGSVLLTRPLSFNVLTIFFTSILTVLLAFFAASTYTRKAQVVGVLLPSQGLIRILPAHGGIVVERYVGEGQAVHAGDRLFLVASERADAANGSAERNISALLRFRRESFAAEQAQQARQALRKIETARRRAAELQAEMERLESQAALQGRRVALAQAAFERYASLAADSFVSSAQVQDRQAELLDQQQRLADLQRAKAAVKRDWIAADAEIHDLEVQSRRDEQANQRSIAAIDQDLVENEARREVVVRAPQDGTISAIAVDTGQSVAANQALASLVPAGSELEAELYAPSRAAGFIKPGMQVLLRYQAFAYQKFGQARGTVREVVGSAMRSDELPLPGAVAAGGASEPLYRVRVKLDRQAVTVYGNAQPLRSGALLDASVLLETRRLYEWLLDPLYSVAGRV
ncbi:HlyD family secretion protein [Ramlibacter sp.]